MESKSKKLRSGYTTGACAAAAAKAAAMLLFRSREPGAGGQGKIEQVEIPFPDGSRAGFMIQHSELRTQDLKRISKASVIKDAGDDPDVTNGTEIAAEVRVIDERRSAIGDCNGKPIRDHKHPQIVIAGGRGVGIVTKPGLAIRVGEAAINPVPLKMITQAVKEAISEYAAEASLNRQSTSDNQQFLVTISVPAGEALAKKTLNRRLGIVGGISILGTTGIVRPVSTEAYTASITASLDVAKAAGLDAVVLSSGRTSEKAHMKRFHFSEEAYVMMGDYVEYALNDAAKHGFSRVHLCAQWAKLVKTAMGTPQTHVRHGALEAEKARDFLITLGLDLPRDRAFNTTREVYDFVHSALRTPQAALVRVCTAAKRYAEGITSGIPVTIHLVSYEGDIIAASE